MKALARDSVGLGTSARERNIADRVLLRARRPDTEVLLVDDIVTPGRRRANRFGCCGPAACGWAAVLAIAAA